jgi:hypothetical protein
MSPYDITKGRITYREKAWRLEHQLKQSARNVVLFAGKSE